jgi:hypothetical protein
VKFTQIFLLMFSLERGDRPVQLCDARIDGVDGVHACTTRLLLSLYGEISKGRW